MTMQCTEYDLIILGGGIAGSSLAIALLNKRPGAKVLIIEKSTEFPQKIGESCSDLTALMLKRLGIQHILDTQVEKTGMRFIFNERSAADRSDTAEFSSPSLRSRINGFHLDRKKFDQLLLNECLVRGASIFRPAEIVSISCSEFCNELTLAADGTRQNVKSRWLADASGRHRYITRTLKWKDLDVPLHTGSVMAHYTNILPPEKWDLPQSAYWKKNAIGPGDFSTVHFMRNRAWWWFIRVDQQTTSVGVVFEKDAVSVSDPADYLDKAIRHDPQLNSILENAVRGPVTYLPQVAYCAENLYSKGIVLIGDSGGFVDPLVSPGIEMILQQTAWISELLEPDHEKKEFNRRAWEKYNRTFKKAYFDRMKLYATGYRFIHSHDLFRNWLRLGFFGYFGLTVVPALMRPQRLKKPVTFNWLERWGISYISWRFTRINKRRMKNQFVPDVKPGRFSFSGVYVTEGWRLYLIPFRMFFLWLADYILLEWGECMRRLRLKR